MSTCAICLDAIDVATTGCTTLSCKHEFHFSCISSWFLNTHNQSSCPCCRKVMTPMENLPEDEDESEYESEYESDEDEEDKYCFFTYANFNHMLRSKGGRGVTMSEWMAMDPVNGEISFYTTNEIYFFLIGNGATGSFTQEEWDANVRVMPAMMVLNPKPISMSHLMADGTWRTTILNPEDDTGVAVVLPENTPDDYGFHATVIANTSAKKLQNIWRSKRIYTLDQIERILMA
uniref:RING-type domain-containing protein n=1 Tax=viral metagenome TaxID=1070528 RepID=A0A6C0L5I7_9ZZZZ